MVKETSDLMLMNHLDELAAFEPTRYPFISLYINLEPDQHGRDNFESFVRKEFKAKAKSLARVSRGYELQTRHGANSIILAR